MFDASRRITPVVLHNGAETRSALVSVPGVGAMVIGGEFAGEAQSDGVGGRAGWRSDYPAVERAAIRSGGDRARRGCLSRRRRRQRQPPRSSSMARPRGSSVSGVMDGVREAGLLVGDAESRALWLGGADATDAMRQDTLRFDGCPNACVSSVGPEWATARLGVSPARAERARDRRRSLPVGRGGSLERHRRRDSARSCNWRFQGPVRAGSSSRAARSSWLAATMA